MTRIAMHRACAVGRPSCGVSSGVRPVRLRISCGRLRRDEYLIVVRQDAVFMLSLFRYARLGWVWSDAPSGFSVPWPCLWVFFFFALMLRRLVTRRWPSAGRRWRTGLFSFIRRTRIDCGFRFVRVAIPMRRWTPVLGSSTEYRTSWRSRRGAEHFGF